MLWKQWAVYAQASRSDQSVRTNIFIRGGFLWSPCFYSNHKYTGPNTQGQEGSLMLWSIAKHLIYYTHTQIILAAPEMHESQEQAWPFCYYVT